MRREGGEMERGWRERERELLKYGMKSQFQLQLTTTNAATQGTGSCQVTQSDFKGTLTMSKQRFGNLLVTTRTIPNNVL